MRVGGDVLLEGMCCGCHIAGGSELLVICVSVRTMNGCMLICCVRCCCGMLYCRVFLFSSPCTVVRR